MYHLLYLKGLTYFNVIRRKVIHPFSKFKILSVVYVQYQGKRNNNDFSYLFSPISCKGRIISAKEKSIRISGQEFQRGIYILYVYRKLANVHVTVKLYACSASDSIWIGPINFKVSSPLLCAWILLRSDSIYRYTVQLAGPLVRHGTLLKENGRTSIRTRRSSPCPISLWSRLIHYLNWMTISLFHAFFARSL